MDSLTNRLEIRLSEANDEIVSLKSMSPEAVDSFMTVMSSLKTIAMSISDKDKLIFSISEGSASCSVEAPDETISSIYEEINIAIKGESTDKDITYHLRRIQEQLIRTGYKYNFTYIRTKEKDIDIYTRLVNTSKITLKRTKKIFDYKIRIVSGFLNQIGGKDPNYHFDYVHGDKKTIVCTKDEAMLIKKYLYQTVNALLVCKEWTDQDKRDEYYHKLILEDQQVYLFRTFFNDYNKEKNLVEKLTRLHDFIDDQFEKPNNNGHEILKCLLVAFNDKNFHLSELKTLLVISKPFTEHGTIKDARKALLETYLMVKK